MKPFLKLSYRIRLMAQLTLAMICFEARSTEEAQLRPNVVFIFADDWGWGDLGCHGNEIYKTPHLDKLAAEGTDFRQFYVNSSVCSPSRTAVMTGLFPSRFCILEAITGNVKSNQDQKGNPDWLDPHAVMLPRLFQQAGYVTGHFGKWHLCGGGIPDAPAPSEYGLDEAVVFAGPAKSEQLDEGTSETADRAVAFIKAHQNEPFYLNVWIHQAHLPHVISWASADKFAHLKDNLAQRVYASALYEGDQYVGQILKALEECNLTDRTLVVFSSDNGPEGVGNRNKHDQNYTFEKGEAETYKFDVPYFNAGSTGEYKGHKRSLYEGGVRVPFIVRWPGHVPKGRIDADTVVSAVDLLPTFCSAAGIALPTDYKGDGENMLKAFRGETVQRTKALYWKWTGLDKDFSWPRWAVRKGDWKLVMNNGDRIELYNIAEDRAEQNNLATQHPELVQALQQDIQQWRETLPTEPNPSCLSETRATKAKKK